MTTSESKGRFFYKTIRIDSHNESNRIANWNALVRTHYTEHNSRYNDAICCYSVPDAEQSIVNCDEHVCLCVCLSANLSAELHVKFSPTFSACYLSRGSVLLWQRCDMFCTSCFFRRRYLHT